MSSYSVAEAKNTLPRLLDRALDGEEVIITRHGKAIAAITALPNRTPEERRAAHAEIMARFADQPPYNGSVLELLKASWGEPDT